MVQQTQCQVEHCQRHANPGFLYCTSYGHNRLNALNDHITSFKNDPFGRAVAECAKENILERKSPVNNICHRSVPACSSSTVFSTKKKWFEEVGSRYFKLFEDMLEAPVRKSPKLRDQRERAEALVKVVISKKITKISLMDGHGRMILYIMQLLLKMKEGKVLENLLFEIVDINPAVTQYHQDFLGACPKVTCVTGDICDTAFSKSNLCYMNFCGISKSLERVKDRLKDLAVDEVVFVSYSVNRWSWSKRKQALFDHQRLKCVSVGSRTNFLTFAITLRTRSQDPVFSLLRHLKTKKVWRGFLQVEKNKAVIYSTKSKEKVLRSVPLSDVEYFSLVRGSSFKKTLDGCTFTIAKPNGNSLYLEENDDKQKTISRSTITEKFFLNWRGF